MESTQSLPETQPPKATTSSVTGEYAHMEPDLATFMFGLMVHVPLDGS